MDKLSKAQKDEYATVFAILALYDGGVSFHDMRCRLVRIGIQLSVVAAAAHQSTDAMWSGLLARLVGLIS